MRKSLLYTALTLTSAISLVVFSSSVLASAPIRQFENRGEKDLRIASNTAVLSRKEDHQASEQARLQDTKLKACQARENGIKQRSTHLTQLATKMETQFDIIASRVEAFYTSKVVSSGKTVANYDTLVSAIQTQKSGVQSALASASAEAVSFNCSATDPKGQLTQYRVDMQSVINSLKNYRTSIKNLIVAVHSVAGVTNSEQNSASESGHQASGSAHKRGSSND